MSGDMMYTWYLRGTDVFLQAFLSWLSMQFLMNYWRMCFETFLECIWEKAMTPVTAVLIIPNSVANPLSERCLMLNSLERKIPSFWSFNTRNNNLLLLLCSGNYLLFRAVRHFWIFCNLNTGLHHISEVFLRTALIPNQIQKLNVCEGALYVIWACISSWFHL